VADLTFLLYLGAAAGNRILTDRGAIVFNLPFLHGIKYFIISKACLHSAGQVSSDINSFCLTQNGYSAIDCQATAVCVAGNLE